MSYYFLWFYVTCLWQDLISDAVYIRTDLYLFEVLSFLVWLLNLSIKISLSFLFSGENPGSEKLHACSFNVSECDDFLVASYVLTTAPYTISNSESQTPLLQFFLRGERSVHRLSLSRKSIICLSRLATTKTWYFAQPHPIIDLVTVFDAILMSRQTCEKLQWFYENLMLNNFRRPAVLKKIWFVNWSFSPKDSPDKNLSALHAREDFKPLF